MYQSWEKALTLPEAFGIVIYMNNASDTSSKSYTLAQFKRDLKVGKLVTTENHVFGTGPRTSELTRVQTKSFARFVERSDGKRVESWCDIPPASQVRVERPGVVTFFRDAEWGDDGPFVTVTIHPEGGEA